VGGRVAERVVTAAELIFDDGLRRPLGDELSIGRDGTCSLVLESKKVSRSHARVFEENGIWFVEDRGSSNGTYVNEREIPPRMAVRLRHGDQIQVGPQRFRFSRPAELEDGDRTESEEVVEPANRLSPLQLQVVRILCDEWLRTGSLDHLPSNDDIAERLGTPGAAPTVKAALRRAYAKAGVANLPPQEKRRALCRVARRHGWI
jgi:pSer/pThr/pTyr-binding forkhead associated (FHA) protein